VVAGSEIGFRPTSATEIAWLSKYVSDQYLDNTSDESRQLPSFFVNDLRLSYNTRLKGIRKVGLTLLVNNLFGELYENNGYTYSGMSGGVVYRGNGYYPQATRNFLLGLHLGI
jgi:iron complex outermembrane recepter protein